MKAKIIVPTIEYGNITYEVEGIPEDINTEADYLLSLRKPQEGLPQKEWNAAVERYLNDATGDTETWAKMSEKQKWWFNETKKGFNRIEAKNK